MTAETGTGRAQGPRPVDALEVLARTEADMAKVGAAVAGVLRAGDTVLLGGDLGAGKTTMTKGMAAALGVEGPVTSPTFVLVHSYRTSEGFDLLHADVWRLEQLQEVVDLAIPELVEEGAAAVVEWGERAAPALDHDCLRVTIDFGEGPEGGAVPSGAPGRDAPVRATRQGGPGWVQPGADGTRSVVLLPAGPSWEERLPAIEAALDGSGLRPQRAGVGTTGSGTGQPGRPGWPGGRDQPGDGRVGRRGGAL